MIAVLAAVNEHREGADQMLGAVIVGIVLVGALTKVSAKVFIPLALVALFVGAVIVDLQWPALIGSGH